MLAKIAFNKPPGASIEDVAEFIRDALSSWGGGLHPEDPMFHSLRGKIDFIVVHNQIFKGNKE